MKRSTPSAGTRAEGRRARMAAFIANGGAKPPNRGRPPGVSQRDGFEDRAIADAHALLAVAKGSKGPVLIYPRHLEILTLLAAQVCAHCAHSGGGER